LVEKTDKVLFTKDFWIKIPQIWYTIYHSKGI